MIVFQPYADLWDFLDAGVLDLGLATHLSLVANQDGGVHLVALGAGRPRTIVAHFYIELHGMGGPVLAIEPGDVPIPSKDR